MPDDPEDYDREIVAASQSFCAQCGARFATAGQFCPSCGAPRGGISAASKGATSTQPPAHGEHNLKTNSLANAGFWCSFVGFFLALLLGFLGLLLGVLGLVLGAVSRGQIQDSEGAQRGRQTATAAILIGIADLAIFGLKVILR